ncbi:TetR/AcrR family transcriptional regulator [Amycolatopsis echigonensis]
MARRRNRKVADIVAAAAEVLAERGYHDTGLDEIAERLDIAKATLYHYFPNKEALVMACMESVGAEVNQQLRDIADNGSGTARDRLTALIGLQLDIIVHKSPQMASLFRQPLDWPQAYQERIRQLQRDHYAIFRSVVREGIQRGEFVVEDEAATIHNLYGAMNYVPVWFQPKRKKDFSEMSEAVVDSLLRLFLPPGAPT